MAHRSDVLAAVKIEHDKAFGPCVRRACTSCGTVNTPQWREGPKGPRSLCNACGVKHLRHVRGRQRTDTIAGKAMRKAITSGISKPQNSRMKAEAKCKTKSCKSEADASESKDSQPGSEVASELCASALLNGCQQQALASDCAAAAAVSLLSMTRLQNSLQPYVALSDQQQRAAAEAQAREQELAKQLELEHERKIEHVRACSAARFEVKTAEKFAAAADAAAAAVGQVLVVKQDNARKAQAALHRAQMRLRQLTASMKDDQESSP